MTLVAVWGVLGRSRALAHAAVWEHNVEVHRARNDEGAEMQMGRTR